MADGIAVTPGIGGTIATDDISGSHYQRIKLIHGSDGVNAGDVAALNPLPVGFSAGIDAPFSFAGPQFNTAGDKVLVAALALNYIRVYGVYIFVDAAQQLYLEDSALGALSGNIGLIAGGRIELPIIGRPYYKLGVGLGLSLHIATTAQTAGIVFYTQTTTP